MNEPKIMKSRNEARKTIRVKEILHLHRIGLVHQNQNENFHRYISNSIYVFLLFDFIWFSFYSLLYFSLSLSLPLLSSCFLSFDRKILEFNSMHELILRLPIT